MASTLCLKDDKPKGDYTKSLIGQIVELEYELFVAVCEVHLRLWRHRECYRELPHGSCACGAFLPRPITCATSDSNDSLDCISYQAHCVKLYQAFFDAIPVISYYIMAHSTTRIVDDKPASQLLEAYGSSLPWAEPSW